MSAIWNYRELSHSAGDNELLERFYHGVYVEEFPDPDERESLENMTEYLRLKEQGWYGANNYHILVISADDGQIAGGVIADYFDRSNAGVIEFMVVGPSFRGQGLGKRLLEEISGKFLEDCRKAGHSELTGICGEVNDPYRRCDVSEHLDGFARMRMWDHFGFQLLDFPYVQPPLSNDQEAVVGLGLMFRPGAEHSFDRVASLFVERFVEDYQIWAMRIPEPEKEPDFQRMRQWLRQRDEVALLDMRSYVGEEEAKAFEIVEVREDDHQSARKFREVFSRTFRAAETAVDVSEFAPGTRFRSDPIPHHHWLWGVQAAGEGESRGLASFFSFPHCGFAGYAALSGRIQRKGNIRRLLRMMERQMVEVNKAAGGWYAECEPDSPASRIAPRLGFFRVPMVYRQPRLHSDGSGVFEGKVLDLFYKPFGRVYGTAALSVADLRRDLGEIIPCVYHLESNGVERVKARMEWPEFADGIVFQVGAEPPAGGHD